MVIKSYGLFWRRDEINWHPGAGNKGAFRLLGRRGKNKRVLQLADFRRQIGIYILYGDYGPHYVGLTRKRGIGKRLKEHLSDSHARFWDRFSWFGFRAVLNKKDEEGICVLKDLASVSLGDPTHMIADTEALLIKAMGLSNKANMKFKEAHKWEQVKLLEVERYTAKLSR